MLIAKRSKKCSKWTDSLESEVISFYHSNVELWKVSEKGYRKAHKSALMDIIVERLDHQFTGNFIKINTTICFFFNSYFFPAKEIDARFRAMKTTFSSNHRKVAKSKSSGSGAADVFTPSWIHYSEMCFLASAAEFRPGISFTQINKSITELHQQVSAESVGSNPSPSGCYENPSDLPNSQGSEVASGSGSQQVSAESVGSIPSQSSRYENPSNSQRSEVASGSVPFNYNTPNNGSQQVSEESVGHNRTPSGRYENHSLPNNQPSTADNILIGKKPSTTVQRKRVATNATTSSNNFMQKALDILEPKPQDECTGMMIVVENKFRKLPEETASNLFLNFCRYLEKYKYLNKCDQLEAAMELGTVLDKYNIFCDSDLI